MFGQPSTRESKALTLGWKPVAGRAAHVCSDEEQRGEGRKLVWDGGEEVEEESEEDVERGGAGRAEEDLLVPADDLRPD